MTHPILSDAYIHEMADSDGNLLTSLGDKQMAALARAILPEIAREILAVRHGSQNIRTLRRDGVAQASAGGAEILPFPLSARKGGAL